MNEVLIFEDHSIWFGIWKAKLDGKVVIVRADDVRVASRDVVIMALEHACVIVVDAGVIKPSTDP